MLGVSFVSCGIVKGDTVMEYGDYKITEAMYSYWIASFKPYFLLEYGSSESYDGFWAQQCPDGRTYAQFFYDFVNSYAKKVLVCMKLYDEYGLSISDETRKLIDERIDELTNSYGGKKEINAYLSSYGLNVKTLEKIYYEEAKVDVVTEYLVGSGGPQEITETYKEEYYNANYFCVNWIYIYTEKKPDTSKGNGDNANSDYTMIDLTEQEKAEKKQLVDDILTKLAAGESFAGLKARYCEQKNDDGTSPFDYYPNGINLSANSYDVYGVEFIKTVQGMEIGTYATYTDEYATRIIVRNPLVKFSDLTPQEYSFMVDFEKYVIDAKMEEYLAGVEITKYDDVAGRYNVDQINSISMSF